MFYKCAPLCFETFLLFSGKGKIASTNQEKKQEQFKERHFYC